MRRRILTYLGFVAVLFGGCSAGTPVDPIAPIDYEPAPTVESRSHDWPWWRGPGRDGKAPEANLPPQWDPETNVVWKAEVAGEGHSSPILWGNRLFLTSADMDEELQQLHCFDRDAGHLIWSLSLYQGGFMHMHGKNSQASPTPACDGERVFAVFINNDALWASATTLDGELLWHRNLGAFKSEHGYGSSPVLYESLLIVNGDNPGGAFLVAIHRETGEVVWKVPRDDTGTYGTPVVAEVAGKPQLLLAGNNAVKSYDPETGELYWTCDGTADTIANTCAFDEQHVFASGGYPQKEILCIRADGSGDVTDTHVKWRSSKGVSYVPSPLVHDGLIYFVSDNGVATCFEAESGEQVWTKRLGGDFSSSFVLAGDRLLVANEKGTVFVIEPGRDGNVVAENDMGERIMATPAIGDDKMYLRTRRHLYCIGSGETADASPPNEQAETPAPATD